MVDPCSREDKIVGSLTPEGETLLDQHRSALWTEPAFDNDSGGRNWVVLPVCQRAGLTRGRRGLTPLESAHGQLDIRD